MVEETGGKFGGERPAASFLLAKAMPRVQYPSLVTKLASSFLMEVTSSSIALGPTDFFALAVGGGVPVGGVTLRSSVLLKCGVATRVEDFLIW